MDKKTDEELILELESLLKRGGRPIKEEMESVTLRISAALARVAKDAYPKGRSQIYEDGLLKALRKDNLLPPPLDADGRPEPGEALRPPKVEPKEVSKGLTGKFTNKKRPR